MLEVREATEADWPAIWPFLRQIVAAGDTFAYDGHMDEAEARVMWMLNPPDRTFPEAFRHPEQGYVGLLLMYRRLTNR
jgi:hypothetical protein